MISGDPFGRRLKDESDEQERLGHGIANTVTTMRSIAVTQSMARPVGTPVAEYSPFVWPR